MVAFLAGVAVWLGLTGDSVRVSSGNSIPCFADPGFTIAEVREIASSPRSTENTFVRAVLDAAEATVVSREPGRHSVEVAFLDAAGERVTVKKRGWPVNWMTSFLSESYDDVVLRLGAVGAFTDAAEPQIRGAYSSPRNPLRIPKQPLFKRYGSVLTYNPPPERTQGARFSARIYPAGLLAPLALSIVVWYAWGAIIVVWRRIRSTPYVGRDKRIRIAITAAIGVGFIALTLFHIEKSSPLPRAHTYTSKQVGFPPALVYWTRSMFQRLPVSLAELRELARAPDGDQSLALMIEDNWQKDAPKGTYLAVVSDAESRMFNSQYTWRHALFPIVSTARRFYMRRADFGAGDLLAPQERFHVRLRQVSVYVNYARGDPKSGELGVAIRLDLVSALLVGCWFARCLSRWSVLLVHRVQSNRRRERGRCLQCGYPLVPQST